MKEKKSYAEWCKILEKENIVKILDNDGERPLASQGGTEKLLTKTEAFNHFSCNTLMSASN